jgi:hypothetical protein
MTSVVAIANMALSRIGNSQRINALDEASIQAEQCALFYETSRDMVLRDYPWGFATSFASLAQLAISDDPSYGYTYALPSDCLKVRGIVNPVFQDGYWPACVDRIEIPRTAFRIISGNRLATSANPVTIEYTAKVDSPEVFDPMFVSALAWRLAAQIAPAIAKDAGAAQMCEQMYRSEIVSAATSMLNEGDTHRQTQSSFITGRGE